MDIMNLPIDAAADHALATSPNIAPIQALQVAMTQAIGNGELQAVDLEVVHHFTPGLYSRELIMRAGSSCVGCLHRTRHLFVLTQGTILIDDGTGLQELTAPAVVQTMPGIKRAIVAITDARMMTHHVTEETDLDKIREAVIVPEPHLLGVAP